MLRRLTGIIAGIEHKLTAPSDWAVDFFQRSIIEPFIVGLTSALPPASPRSYTGARLVTETEDYIDTAGGRPVHISELCSTLKVSRRSHPVTRRAKSVNLEANPRDGCSR